MGGIIARYWIKKLNGYLNTKRFISIGSPHNGTLTAQFVPDYPFKGISEIVHRIFVDLRFFSLVGFLL